MKKSPLIIQSALSLEYIEHKKDIDKAIQRVLRSGRYILGKELERFEKVFAEYVGAKYAVGVGNGFDALYICLKTAPVEEIKVYIKNELHISSSNAVKLVGGKIVDYDNSNIVIPVISPKTGDYRVFSDKIIIEDACQSIGMHRKIPYTAFASCYSFHPLKLLHCYGDGGAIAINDKSIYKSIKQFRNHGRIGKTKQYGLGVNSRLDEIQAAVLNVMLEKGIKCGYL